LLKREELREVFCSLYPGTGGGGWMHRRKVLEIDAELLWELITL